MAVQVVELPTQPQPTWGQDLGAVFQEAGQGYAREQDKLKSRAQQLEDERRRRQEMLSDTQSARDYEDSRIEKEHEFERTDFDYKQAAQEKISQLHQSGELQRIITTTLVNSGYLSPDDVGNKDAIRTAYLAAQRDGLIQKYTDLVQHGYLKVEDITDPKKVADAQALAAKDSTAAFKAGQAQRGAALGAAGSVQNQIVKEQAAIAQIEDRARQAAAAAAAPPDPRQVQTVAAQMAAQTARVPGHPSQAEIQAAMGPAAEQIKAQNEMNARQADEQAKVLIAPHQRILASLSTRAGQFEKNQIFATPDDSDTAAASPAANLAPASGGVDQNRAAARAAFGGSPSGAAAPATAPAAASPAPNTLSDAGADPQGAAIINAENARRSQALVAMQIDAPLTQASQQLQDIQKQIAAVKANPNYGAISSYGVPGLGPIQGGPDQQAKALASSTPSRPNSRRRSNCFKRRNSRR